MDTHRYVVRDIATKVRGFYDEKQPFRVCHGSIEPGTDPKHIVDTSYLSHVLDLNTKSQLAMVEPNVTMDNLVRETLKHGLIPPIVPAFPPITVGDAFSGTAAGSSSFLYGYFDRSITWVEAVLGDGRIVKASNAHNADLFEGMAGSLGTVAIPTLLQIQLVAAADYVETTYIPISSNAEALETMQKCADDFRYDFVESLIFGEDSTSYGVVIAGRLNSFKLHPERRYRRACDPWFYLHSLKVGTFTESVPVLDYLFRHDRGLFCLGRLFFESIPFTKTTRWLLDPAMRSGQISETMRSMKWSQHLILQDVILPTETVDLFLDYAEENVGIYPLRLCPVRHQHNSMMRPNPLLSDKFVSVGIYGYTEDTILNFDAFKRKNREIERVVTTLGGAKLLYGQSFTSTEEFWRNYPRDEYEDLRTKYNAHCLPSVYEVLDSNNACDPQNFEPNLALNIEIADLINAKKGNAPREAAVAIVQYVNNRNPNISLLALNLLDICVKNCGYPFHLQISTKEFLNELVRRFPERPPVHPSRVQNRILELIEEWRQTICQTSKHKEDLGFVRDMHRLLSYKGYIFPEVRSEDAAVLNPSDNLRSAEEMEEEEKIAQSAKLQELIRRGGPQDLQEANKLMKVMAGYDTRNKTDYRAKAAEEVGKIQQKARILEEMLQGYKPGDQVKEGDVFEELANALQSAQPKIQKMCEEESDDHEAVAKLFEINDSIHRTIERYKLIKKGDIEGANKIPKGTLGTSGAGVSKGPDNELSLIDFGGPEDTPAPAQGSSSAPSQPASKGNALEDDLLGLSIGGESFGQTGNISLGPSDGTAIPGLSSGISSPPPQTQQPAPPQPNYDPFGSLGAQPAPTITSPSPSIFSQPKPAQPPQPAQAARPTPDPFAALSSQAPRQASPFQFQQSVKSPAANDLLGLGGGGLSAPPPQKPSAQPAANDDDEWTFASAVPDQSKDITVNNTTVEIIFNVSRESDSVLLIKSRISNKTPQPISDLTLQVAVSKAYTLKLEPQSGVSLLQNQVNGITQVIRLHNVQRGQGNNVKMRWKVAYSIGGTPRNEVGEIPSLGVP